MHFETKHYLKHPVLVNRFAYILRVLNDFYGKNKSAKIRETEGFKQFKRDTYWLFTKLCPELTQTQESGMVEEFSYEGSQLSMKIFVKIIPKNELTSKTDLLV
ncbi:hypothetical protein [Aeromonas phage phiWae14]|nr:hypothetical protein [Aeromonas phage phiWae14]